MSGQTGGKKNKAFVRKLRDRINSTLLTERLEKHAAGQIEMTATQIQAAKILLAKTTPDLKAVEHSGPGGGAQRVVISAEPVSAQEWADKWAPKVDQDPGTPIQTDDGDAEAD